MRQFTLKQLRYFVVAGELGSTTQAARKLHVSQPLISAAIQHIETVTGIHLFVRHHAQGLSLTPSGHQLMVRARQLLREAEGVEKYALSLGDEIGGELYLVAFGSFASVFLPQLLRSYADRHPSVSLYCDEHSQADIIAGLQQGDYELAFTYDLNVPEELDFTPLYRFPPYAVVSSDHPLSTRESISLAELVTYPMVLLDWPLSREYFLAIFTQNGLVPTVAHRARSMDMLRGLVRNGFGFSLFNTPLSALEPEGDGRLRALKIKDHARALLLGIACIRALRLSPAAEALFELALNTESWSSAFPEFDFGVGRKVPPKTV